MSGIGRFVVVCLAALLAAAAAEAAPVDARLRGEPAGLRVPFVENADQVDARVAFYARTFAGTLFVTHPGELVYSLPARSEARRDARRPAPEPGWALAESFVRGRPRPAGREPSGARVSSFVGGDPARWRAQVQTYDEVGLGEVWRGVSVAVRASGRNVEKVFTVAPGVPVSRIRVGVRGVSGLAVGADGALVARTGLGDVTFTRPLAYQERDGLRHPVTVAYRTRGKEYGFTVGDYDRALPLIIDPLLQSTYLGGASSDVVRAVAIAADGDVYVVGSTASLDFPGTLGGAQPARAGSFDAFVARLNGALTELKRATYLGGTDFDQGCGLAVHPTTGEVFVAGTTESVDFPQTTGGAQPTYGGGFEDVFVARLNAELTSLAQATYLGGSDEDFGGCSLAFNAAGDHVYVTGATFSTDFPGTTGGVQATKGANLDAFVARLGTALTTGTLAQATYLGGDGFEEATSLVVSTTGDVYVAGFTSSTDFPGTPGGAQPTKAAFTDGFIARLGGGLTVGTLGQATYLGGNDDDIVTGLAIHPTTGDVYVVGYTFSDTFPGTAGGAQPARVDGIDGFVARLLAGLTTGSLAQATYLGGSGDDSLNGIAIHPVTGDVYVTGETGSPDFPRTLGGAQPSLAQNPDINDDSRDAVVVRLRRDLTTGALTQATYLGGARGDSGLAIAIHPTTGDVYVAGETDSSDFPGTAGGARPTKDSNSDEGFVTRLTANLVAPDPGPEVTVTKTHAGDFAKGEVGRTYTLRVRNLGVAQTVGTVTVTDVLPAGLIATALDGPGWTCVLGTLTCTRGDALAAGASYPDVTLTVSVSTSAPGSVTNTATVTGGGDVGPANNVASDQTTITSFADVPAIHQLFPWIEALAAAGITGGCASSPQQYCPDALVPRDQMAVFLLRGMHGAGFVPPAPTGTVFADVPADHPLAAWIEQLAAEGVTGGCATSPQRYCPGANVTRAQMAVFLLRAKHGPGFVPPAATGTVFADVPAGDPFAPWIEQLSVEGITGGCATSPARFCPDAEVTRGQMAVFLVRAFNLPI